MPVIKFLLNILKQNFQTYDWFYADGSLKTTIESVQCGRSTARKFINSNTDDIINSNMHRKLVKASSLQSAWDKIREGDRVAELQRDLVVDYL